MQTVHIQASRPYDVLVGRGLLREAGALIATRIPCCTMVLVTDSTVDALYGGAVAASLQDAGFTVLRFSFPAGEASKNIATLSALLEFMGEHCVTRTDCIAALGGGVTGDLAGFAAAVYLRGVRYVQLPTTLLAAVDSSVGGKAAVDLTIGKNLAGAFHQPSLVLCDCDTFQTLPANVFTDGLAECIKYGVIADSSLLTQFSSPLTPEMLAEIVLRCICIKGEVVEEDEFDHDKRRLLNFGHTAGHAVEACSIFSIPHGHAVAIGMAVMTRAAQCHGLCSEACANAIIKTIAACGLPTRSPYTAEQLYDVALADKKRQGDKIALIVPREIGCCEALELPVGELLEWLQSGMGEQA